MQTKIQQMQEQLRKILEKLKIIKKKVDEIKKEDAVEMSNREKIYQTAKKCIGQDMSKLLDNLGCVEALYYVLKKAECPIKENMSTYRLRHELTNPLQKQWIKVSKPLPGDIILSATGYGNGRIRNGHAGIVSDKSRIMSNNSTNSLWQEHMNMWSWRYRYSRIGGYPIEFFRRIN